MVGVTLDTLPDRPVGIEVLRDLERVDGVRSTHVRFSVTSHHNQPPERVAQFVVVFSSGRAVAAHFNPWRGGWSDGAAVDLEDPEDDDQLRAAIEELDEDLERRRVDDAEYGEAVSDQFEAWLSGREGAV